MYVIFHLSTVLILLCIFYSDAVEVTRRSHIQIAFGVMTYQKQHKSVGDVLSDFHNLMQALYTHHNHLYVLHVDSKSDENLVTR